LLANVGGRHAGDLKRAKRGCRASTCRTRSRPTAVTALIASKARSYFIKFVEIHCCSLNCSSKETQPAGSMFPPLMMAPTFFP
jgi:hypothetical protein